MELFFVITVILPLLCISPKSGEVFSNKIGAFLQEKNNNDAKKIIKKLFSLFKCIRTNLIG